MLSIIKQLLTLLIQHYLIPEKASAVKTDTQSVFISPSQTTELPSASKGKIRYVGGYRKPKPSSVVLLVCTICCLHRALLRKWKTLRVSYLFQTSSQFQLRKSNSYQFMRKLWKKQVENKTHWMDLSIYMTKYLNFFEILEQQSRFNLSMNIGSA